MPTTPRARAAFAVLATCAAVLLSTSTLAVSPAGAVPLDAVPTAPASIARWHVTALGAGGYDVAWTSPTRFPLTGDRPTITGGGLTFGPSTVRSDGRTVHALVTSSTAPDTSALDVVLSGDRLDEPGRDHTAARTDSGRGARAVEAAVPPTHPLDAPDPGVPGPYATTSSDYTLPGVKVPGLPAKVEMVGHVVEPAADAATGPRPLVLFLHGRHEVCYRPGHPNAYTGDWPCPAPFEEIPSQLGYVYIQELLASQGYTTVSVRVNGINAQDYRLADGGADARAFVVERHLDYWTTIAAAHEVDLSRVVLVGHSRGGEGVDRASLQIPLDAPYTIAGQVLIAPVDFASHTAPYVPTVTLLPYCDGDVSDLQGQKFTDSGRNLAVGSDTSLKSSVLVMGADHNFFNTEWTPGISAAPSNDDWYGGKHDPCGVRTPERLTAPEQRSVGAAYVAGAVDLFTGDQAYLPMFDGSHVTVASIGDADVRSAALGGGRSLRRPGVEASPTLATGGATTKLCAGVTTYDPGAFNDCGRLVGDVITPHWAADGEGIPTRQFFEMAWDRAGAVGGLQLSQPLDLSTDRLELRTIVDPARGDVRLRVRIGDGAGHTATLTPEDGETLPALLRGRYVTKLWGQALIVDAADPANGPDVGDVDLTDVTSVELVGDSVDGRVWIADLSAAPATLPAVPATRLPLIELGDLTLAEGDQGRTHVGQIPFHIVGDVTAPGRFRVVTYGQARGDTHALNVTVAPGQTDGSIPVAYASNTVDDYNLTTQVVAWPLRGVATDDYLGRFRLQDDDPTPPVVVTGERSTISEGQDAVVHVELGKAVGYDLYASGQVVRGTGQVLHGDDVPLSWLKRHGSTEHLDQPLSAYLNATLRAGRRSVDLVVPVAQDGRQEPKETLSLRLRIGHQTFVRHFTIRAST